MNKFVLAALVFAHWKSPAAIYRNPYPFFTKVLAGIGNTCLRVVERLLPGKTVTCSLCDRTSRKFGYTAAISCNVFAANDICFHCGSNSRTRTIVRLLGQKMRSLDGQRTIADVGASPSTNHYFERFPKLNYLVVDKYKDFGDVKCDITNIDLAASSMDGILCCHTLEHVDDYQKAISELLRILKPGHFGVIAVPQTSGLITSYRTGQDSFYGYGHLWDFGDDFADILAKSGFRVETSMDFCEGTEAPYHVVQKPTVD